MKILVAMPVNEMHKELLTSKAPDAEWVFKSSKDVSDLEYMTFDAIIGNVPPAKLQNSANLKWLQLNSAGTDGYTGKGSIPEDTILTNATGAYGLAIAEHMMGSLLYLMKKLNLYAADVNDHAWTDHGPVKAIYGSKTLVVGCGDIGSEFAKRMHAFGSTVTGIKRSIGDIPEYIDRMCTMEELEDCLKDADIVATCLPSSKETYHLFCKETFAKMKKGAYFINVGRGNAVDSDALADALNSGHLAGAAVDVTDPEPLPAEHPLWNADNILITPHISGGYHLQETHDRIVRIAADNLVKFLDCKLSGIKK